MAHAPGRRQQATPWEKIDPGLCERFHYRLHELDDLTLAELVALSDHGHGGEGSEGQPDQAAIQAESYEWRAMTPLQKLRRAQAEARG